MEDVGEAPCSLMSNIRFRDTSQKGRSLSVEAVSDRSRVIFCEAFRQLHRKAQVFSLEDAGSARTRLTHSLEVSQIGQYLTQLVFENADSDLLRKVGWEGKQGIVETFIETSCLVHDIGNPPFGHFGEVAIRHWFQNNMDTLEKAWCSQGGDRREEFRFHIKDFLCFDGNPQGFRILTRLVWGTDRYSLNLTLTQLASSVKYYCSPAEIDGSGKNQIRKKAGFFSSEEILADVIASELGMVKNCRHPLVYLMEAADDIAYCLSDIEDAIHKRLLSEEGVIGNIRNKIANGEPGFSPYAEFLPKQEEGRCPVGSYLMFRVRCINYIARLVAKEFVNNCQDYFDGTCPPLIDRVPTARVLLEFLKGLARQNIYNSAIVLKNELIGSKVITGILDAFLPMLIASPERFAAVLDGKQKDDDGNHISSEKALFHQIPPQYVRTYQDAVSRSECEVAEYRRKFKKFAAQHPESKRRSTLLLERFARTHMIVDYLAGLTDSQALDAYKLLGSS